MRVTRPATCAIALVLALTGGPAHAEGFRVRDLTVIEADVAAVFGSEYQHWAIPTTLNLSCCDREEQAINLSIDRHTDEIGQEDRTDRDYISGLEKVCAGMGPACEIGEVDAGPALGRILSVCTPGTVKTTNIFVVKDGDRLTIQSAATDAAVARRNAEKALDAARVLLLAVDRRLAVEAKRDDSAPPPGCSDTAAR